MKSYCVTWAIDIDADSPEEAARIAQAKQQKNRPDYWVGVFDVDGETIDLDALDEAAA